MVNHIDEQRACAAGGWHLAIQDVNQGKPGAGAVVCLKTTTDQGGLAILRWVCGEGERSLTVWFEPFEQVCPVDVVFRHRRAVQLGLNKGGVVRLFRSFFHQLTCSPARLLLC